MSFLLRSRLLGGASVAPCYAPETGAGAGGGDGGAGAGAAGAAAGAAAAAGSGAGGAAGGTGGTGAGAAAAADGDGAAGAAASLASGAAAGGDGKGAAAAGDGKTGQQQQLAQWLGGAPANWREELAGEDKGFLNQLKRHASPASAFDWLRKTSLKLSAGELKEVKQAPAPDASEEERAAWRKENGLPEKSEAYVASLKLPDGVVLGEADKPIAADFAGLAHAEGWSQAQFDKAVAWHFDNQAKQAQARAQRDNDNRVAAQQQLVSEMGGDFKPNMNVLQSFWTEHGGAEVTGPNGKSTIADAILTARSGDGRLLGDIPEVAKFFANVGRELNPAATILPLGGSTDLKGVQTRMSEIKGMMYINGRQNPAYFGNEALQKEYRELIDAEQTMQKRAG